jgi:hypothetical protein
MANIVEFHYWKMIPQCVALSSSCSLRVVGVEADAITLKIRAEVTAKEV